MYRGIKKRVFMAALVAFLGVVGVPVFAGDDPSIQGRLREDIKTAMRHLIERNTVGEVFSLYDPVKGKLFRLQLVKLHEGIEKKGDYFVSCADFKDAAGNLVDLDFLVLQNGDRMIATQAVIHKADGEKRTYHLEG